MVVMILFLSGKELFVFADIFIVIVFFLLNDMVSLIHFLDRIFMSENISDFSLRMILFFINFDHTSWTAL
jgi:hypothetical protein